MRRFMVTLVCVLCLVWFGCGRRQEAGGASGQPVAEHAAADVVPGSFEDWCGEHQVPESQCTRCDPALIAAFRATNDWCPEHGLPESQCLVCNPDLEIERPPKPEAR